MNDTTTGQPKKSKIGLGLGLVVLCAVILAAGYLLFGGSSEERYQEQYDLGMKYLSEGNYEEAIIAFEAAIEIDPRQTGAYFSLAEIYEEIWQTEKAIAQLERLLEMDEQNVEGYLRLAELYHSLGELDKAREISRQGYEATGDERLAEKLEDYLASIETRLTMIGEDSFELRMRKADMFNYQEALNAANRRYESPFKLGVDGWTCSFIWPEVDMWMYFDIWLNGPAGAASYSNFTLDELNSMSDEMLAEAFNVRASLNNWSDDRHRNIGTNFDYSLRQDGDYLILTVNNANDIIWQPLRDDEEWGGYYNGDFVGDISNAVYHQRFCQGKYSTTSASKEDYDKYMNENISLN